MVHLKRNHNYAISAWAVRAAPYREVTRTRSTPRLANPPSARSDRHRQAMQAIFEFIAGWYNSRRRHSALGYRSPAAVEQRTTPRTQAA